MRTRWQHEMTRRTFVKAGLAGAALLATPWPLRAQSTPPHFLVTMFAEGGWDPTLTLDVHDPADPTDGIDIDVPGQPVSAIRTVGGLTYLSNAVTRPAVDTFFNRWAGRSAIVNGINTRSTSHEQSEQLILTGYLDPTRADFAVMAAHHRGQDLPLPHLLLSGDSFGGPFAGLSGRVGGQLGAVLAYNRVPAVVEGEEAFQAVSAVGEAYVQQALEWQRLASPSRAVAGRLGQFDDAGQRADRLVRLASSLPQDFNDGTTLAASLAGAFRSGMTTSVTLEVEGGFDTHDDNTQQDARWNGVFTTLDQFLTALAAEPGLVRPSLLEETTVVCLSEFGRTPQFNGTNGKDHHPWTSMLFVGKRVRPGVTVGMTDGQQEGVKTNFDTGRPDDTGELIDVQNMVAGILTLMGANSEQYVAGVAPFTAMIAA